MSGLTWVMRCEGGSQDGSGRKAEDRYWGDIRHTNVVQMGQQCWVLDHGVKVNGIKDEGRGTDVYGLFPSAWCRGGFMDEAGEGGGGREEKWRRIERGRRRAIMGRLGEKEGARVGARQTAL